MGDKYLTYHLGNKHSIYIDTCVNDGDIYTKSRFSFFFFNVRLLICNRWQLNIKKDLLIVSWFYLKDVFFPLRDISSRQSLVI